MRNRHPGVPLASADLAWLRMESPSNRMVVNAFLVFDQPLDLERVVATIEERLLRPFPRFRQRLARPRLGRPRWVEDPAFDLRAHVHRIGLPPPGGQAALEALVSDLMSGPLDASRPLWQLYLVDGYEGGSVLVVRLHHCIADGFELMRVMLSLTDEQAAPNTAQAEGAPEPWRAPPPAAGGNAPGGRGRRVAWQRRVRAGVRSLGRLLRLPAQPPTLLKGPLGVPKRAAWSAPIALERVKALRRASGTTVNDIMMALLSGALRRYLIARRAGDAPPDLRAIVPVNLRTMDEPVTLGNRFGLVFLDLPVGVAEPTARLAEVARRMAALKTSPEALVAFGLLELLGRVTPGVEDLALRFFGKKGTVVATNVPGPSRPRYFAGQRIRTLMFFVPQSARLGLGASVISYAGELRFGIAADQHLVPDPATIVALAEDELAILERAHGLATGGPEAPPPTLH